MRKWLVLFIFLSVLTAVSCDRIFDHNTFEAGKCYVMKDDNPFRASDVHIKVLQVKEEWIQYIYVFPEFDRVSHLRTAHYATMSHIFEEEPCL